MEVILNKNLGMCKFQQLQLREHIVVQIPNNTSGMRIILTKEYSNILQ